MKWINVKDRLPEEDRPVMGCVADKYSLTGKVSLSIVYYYGIFNGWQALDDGVLLGQALDDGDSLDVTHWMPLPEPPAGTYVEDY
jgi:hypothetical protein